MRELIKATLKSELHRLVYEAQANVATALTAVYVVYPFKSFAHVHRWLTIEAHKHRVKSERIGNEVLTTINPPKPGETPADDLETILTGES